MWEHARQSTTLSRAARAVTSFDNVGAGASLFFAGRMRVAGAIALGGHALALLATRPPPHAPEPPPVVPSLPPEPFAEIAVEVDPVPELPAARLPSEAPAPPPEIASPLPAPPHRASMAPGIAKAGPGESPSAPGAGGDPLLPVATAALPAVAASITARPDALPPPLLPLAVHAPPAVLGELAAPEGASPTSASAQVSGTVQRVAQTGGPRQGHGVLRITVGEDGTVTGVSASGTGWDAVASAIRAALAGRRLRVPSGARGVVISFAIDAMVTRAPPVLTGEARAHPSGLGGDAYRGADTGALNMAVIDYRALLPIERRVVKLQALGEEAL